MLLMMGSLKKAAIGRSRRQVIPFVCLRSRTPKMDSYVFSRYCDRQFLVRLLFNQLCPLLNSQWMDAG